MKFTWYGSPVHRVANLVSHVDSWPFTACRKCVILVKKSVMFLYRNGSYSQLRLTQVSMERARPGVIRARLDECPNL